MPSTGYDCFHHRFFRGVCFCACAHGACQFACRISETSAATIVLAPILVCIKVMTYVLQLLRALRELVYAK